MRDVLYSAKVTSVNGCTRVREPFLGYSECELDEREVFPVKALLERSGSDILHNLAATVGVGVVF